MNPKKISIIVCSIEAGKYARTCESFRRLMGDRAHEIIGIHDARSLAEGYNRGVLASTGEILVFSHDDILILDENFAFKITERLNDFDLLGFAGTSRLVNGTWFGAGQPYLHGVVSHARPKSPTLTLDVFGASEWPVISGIKAIDGLCMIATRQLATSIGFDAQSFDGFHLYDLDFSFSAYQAGFRLGVCCDIPIIHESTGNFDANHQQFAERFVSKHGRYLDASAACDSLPRQPGKAARFKDHEALKRAWQEHFLKRTSLAIRREAAFLYGKPLTSNANDDNTPIRCTKTIAAQPPETPATALQNIPAATAAFDHLAASSSAERQPLAMTANVESSKEKNFNEKYRDWLEQRAFLTSDFEHMDRAARQESTEALGFHFLIRLAPGLQDLLADTLDSLNQQLLGAWHLDIIATEPSPEGLDQLPCLGWHTVNTIDESKEVSERLVEHRRLDWIVELPVGARLDPLYLWRIANDAATKPGIQAFFVDDDCCSISGDRHSPRLKPGVNQSVLMSSDLAGPIAVCREGWKVAGGASPYAGSPWFSLLLRLADSSGWASIGHIPDVLITYPGKFPSHVESCLLGLLACLQNKKIDAEIVPVSGQSWCLRYPLAALPPVTVAILSLGHLDLLSRCLDSIIDNTSYANLEIHIVLTQDQPDPELDSWLTAIEKRTAPPIRATRTAPLANHATRCNTAVSTSPHEFVLLLREEALLVQANWLEELVRTAQQSAIAAVSPLLISPGTGFVRHAGGVLGLMGTVASPYQEQVKLGTPGYLDGLLIARDVSALPSECMLVRKAAYLAVDGMDEIELGNHLADTDLCQKLRELNLRLIFQPQAQVVFGGIGTIEIEGETAQRVQTYIDKARATEVFNRRWTGQAAVDPFFNPNLTLSASNPSPETAYRAQWQYIPSPAPRILARSLPNGQQIFRITSPLRALRKAGLAAECNWTQQGTSEPSVAEIRRLAPDAIIVQHYLHSVRLAGLKAWRDLPDRPFVVYAIDDLITNIPKSNPFSRDIPANSRALIRYALAHCDRMVAATDFLAETYRHFIDDIRVVPNRLEQEIWLPLQSRKRTGAKARIGWAGGTTHQGDLILLKEIIEQTRNEADWIFFGMCPDEIRPLLAEYHPFGDFQAYPARLAALNLDIAVAPLAEHPFNQAKSNLRLLEYGILGIPVVCTDIDPYRNSPACCVKNTPTAWIEALRARIYDADGRENEGSVLRQWVHRNYLLENHLEEWLEAHLPD